VFHEEKIMDDQLVIVRMVLGLAQTNTYILCDQETKNALLIDPAWDGADIFKEVERRGWRIQEIALTHAHFDHIGGVVDLLKASSTPIPIGMHPSDEFIRASGGGAAVYGFTDFDPGPEPSITYEHGMQLNLGEHILEIRHTPGHSPGHVIFNILDAGLTFCGDIIFQRSIGRTDFPGGSTQAIFASIRQEILSLPDETRLLPGHGPETTVGEERRLNPFLTGEVAF
jgi:glyoxylase-like metal-dependent hydrolase (beta-lactamase superfamily II)